MTIPVSAIFTEIDWNQRALVTADPDDAKITDAAYGILSNATISQGAKNTSEGTLLTADKTNSVVGGVDIATVVVDTTVPATFTFEIDFAVLGDLPKDFSSQDDRVFIGAINSNGYTAGLLLSTRGIGLAPSPYTPEPDIRLLQGSYRFLFESDGSPKESVTLRMVVEEDENRATVYIDDTGTVYGLDNTYGAHSVAYTVAATKSTLDSQTDRILIALRASNTTASHYQLLLKSLRLAAGIVAAPDRPVAVIPYVDTVLVGRRLMLDGRESYSPDGLPLAYHWEVEEAPEGSQAVLGGSSYPTATLGDSGDDNEIVFEFGTPSERFNGVTISVVKPEAIGPLKLELLNPRYVQVSLETKQVGLAYESTTTASELVSAFSSPIFVGYDPNVAEVINARLGDSVVGDGLVPTGNLTLVGGYGSSKSKVGIQIDKPGIYRFSLRVSDGTLESIPVIATVMAVLDKQLLRHRPNTDYIWRSLSDFWNLVKDKAAISTVWSGAAQIISDELMRLFQFDYNKSLRDISRKFQRRWLSYRLKVDIPTSLQNSLVLAGGGHWFVKPSTEFLNSTSTEIAFGTVSAKGTLINPATGTALTEIPAELANTHCVIANYGGTTGLSKIVSTDETADPIVSLSTRALEAVRVLDSGTFGFIAQDPADPAVTATNYFTTRGYQIKLGALQAGDKLVIDLDGTAVVRNITNVYPTYSDGGENKPITNTVEFDGTALSTTGVYLRWQVVRETEFTQIFQMPYFDLGTRVALKPLKMNFGDAVEVHYVNPITKDITISWVPILLTTTREVYPDWRPLFSELNEIAEGLFALGDKALSGLSKPPTYTIRKDSPVFSELRIKSLYRTTGVPVRADLISVPILGASTVSAELVENREYEITPGFLKFIPKSEEVTVFTEAGSHVIRTEPALDPSLFGSGTIIFTEGEIGAFPVSTANEQSIRLERPILTTGTYKAIVPRYAFNSPIPNALWAEVNYFDNYQAIENNFGLLAGIPKSLLEEEDINLDYLTIVRAVWFAFLSGPTLDNIKLATEAFMGLPFSEVTGQVTVINPDETENLGRIVVKEDQAPGYRTYFYPNYYPIAINPKTGRQIKSVSLKQSEADYRTLEEQRHLQEIIDDPLSDTTIRELAVVALKKARTVDDSRIDAYTGLVDAAQVYDYVSAGAPTQYLFSGSNQLTKYHTFVIQIPSKGLTNLNFLPLLYDFVNQWKPMHTKVLFFGVLPIEDQIDVEDDLNMSLTLSLGDSAYTSPYQKLGEGASSDNARTYPTDVTYDNNVVPGAPGVWDYTDVVEKYDSGYVSGVLDDYSGDASWNERHNQSDMINSLDSDIDVMASKMWVPIIKDLATDDFELGEEVELLDMSDPPNPAVLTGYGWDSTGTYPGFPPIIEHIGAGVHPKIPFDVVNVQNQHRYTYLLLGFYREDGTNNFGTTHPLRALQRLDGTSDVYLRGKTSGARAEIPFVTGTSRHNLDQALDPEDDKYQLMRRYFILEHIFELDKLLLHGPKVNLYIEATMYIPAGGWGTGVTVSALADESPFIEDDLEIQHRPFDTVTTGPPHIVDLADNEQLVPSFSGGFWVSSVNDPLTADITWGYNDQGESSQATPSSTWLPDPVAQKLENIHIGRRVASWKSYNKTHGFVQFYIPAPKIDRVTEPGEAKDIRLEGYYFVDADPNIPVGPYTSDPSTFVQDIGGCWIWVRKHDSTTEEPVAAFDFEVGTAGGAGIRTVLGVDGFDQTSTGHILEFDIPATAAATPGDYDIILRNARPYQQYSTSAGYEYHVDETVIENAFTVT